MARLRRDAMARGAVPVRTRGIVLGECGVPDVVDLVLDVPVVADAAGDLGCSLFGQVGHAVDAFRQTCQRGWGYVGLCLVTVGSDAPDPRVGRSRQMPSDRHRGHGRGYRGHPLLRPT